MGRRSGRPWIIWGMLLGEQWRLILLTTTVLVVVIAFAGAVKPLADGKLDPGQTLKFMLLAIPPMLQFALPFAAGFGATLAHHRFAADNEAQAAMVGGVSHRALLAPAVLTGLALSVALAGMTHFIIPDFLRSMERLVARDVGRILVNSIRSGQSVRLPDGVVVHADAVDEVGPDGASGATNRLLLQGVVAVKADGEGAIEWEVAARSAGVWMFAGGGERGETAVTIRLLDAEVARRGEVGGETGATSFRFSTPGGFTDDPKFHSAAGLRRLRAEPERIGAVDLARRRLASAMALARTERALAAAFAGGSAALVDAEDQWVSVRSGGLRRDGDRWALVGRDDDGAATELVWRLKDERARIQRARRAWLSVDDSSSASAAGRVLMTLDLEEVETRDPSVGSASTRARQVIGPLRMPEDLGEALLRASAMDLLAAGEEEGARTGDEKIAGAARALRVRIEDLDREILSKEQERWAASAACLVMVVAGAVAAMRMGESRPLLVYAWSFFPSITALITVAAGQGLTHKVGLPGLALLWSGVGGLGLFTLAEFARLARH